MARDYSGRALSEARSYNNAATKVAANFTAGEFRPASKPSTWTIHPQLVALCQNLRTHFGAPLTVVRANVAEADVRVSGVSPAAVALRALALGVGGVLYAAPQGDAGFVRVNVLVSGFGVAGKLRAGNSPAFQTEAGRRGYQWHDVYASNPQAGATLVSPVHYGTGVNHQQAANAGLAAAASGGIGGLVSGAAAWAWDLFKQDDAKTAAKVAAAPAAAAAAAKQAAQQGLDAVKDGADLLGDTFSTAGDTLRILRPVLPLLLVVAGAKLVMGVASGFGARAVGRAAGGRRR